MLRRFRRFINRRRNVSPLYCSSPDENYHMIHMQLLQFIEKSVGDHVYLVGEELIEATGPDVFPHTFQIRITVNTDQGLPLHFNLFVKILIADQCDLAQRERAYMRLDVLINLKKEIQMYSEVIPKIAKFQKLRMINTDCRVSNLFEKCFGTRISIEPRLPKLPDYSSAILLSNPHEKYTFQACETEGSRNNGFTYDTTILILRDMAYFHAGTLAMRLKKKALFLRTIVPILNLEVKEYEQAPPVEMLFKELISYGLRDLQLSDDQRVAIRDSLQLSRLYNRFVREETDQTWYALSYSRYSMSYIMTKQTWEDATNPSKLIDLHRVGFDHCCKDLANFIFTSVRPESFNGQWSFSNLLHEYLYEFLRTLRSHRVPMGQYTWDNFRAEFHAVGAKMLADIFMNIRTSFCRNYKGNEDPILSNEYRKRIAAALNTMTIFQWIKVFDSNSANGSPDSDLIVFD
ncbi:hypothetical protein HUJ04_006809 [Dendroctonus ponderosae]|uniref:Mab-21-like HhH/H2TH-like domain-containing protein n=1 Tax=Dendroctonus ponderosae TaxID=77166 RepID=A0AAR5Q511_DENPD|nr:hypothetical protein HUJ04_006809 [Dendroctonus ponderosae]